MLALFLLMRGHNEPGGGFVGGLVAASAIALYALAAGVDAARKLLRVDVRALMGAGLALAVGAGLLAFLAQMPFLTGQWPGWQVPVINYAGLINPKSGRKSMSRARIVIIKTLGESTQVNYIGLATEGLPKLKKVSAGTLVEKKTGDLPDTVFSEVSIDDLEAVIPRLGRLTRIVEEAAYNS